MSYIKKLHTKKKVTSLHIHKLAILYGVSNKSMMESVLDGHYKASLQEVMSW